MGKVVGKDGGEVLRKGGREKVKKQGEEEERKAQLPMSSNSHSTHGNRTTRKMMAKTQAQR